MRTSELAGEKSATSKRTSAEPTRTEPVESLSILGQIEQVVSSADCRSAETVSSPTTRVSEQISATQTDGGQLSERESADPPRRRRRLVCGISRDGKWVPLSCVYCGAPADCFDHVIPRSRGGSDDADNIVPACVSCNSSKGNRTLEQFQWTRMRQEKPGCVCFVGHKPGVACPCRWCHHPVGPGNGPATPLAVAA